MWHFVWTLDSRLFHSQSLRSTMEYRKLSNRQISRGREFLERTQCVKKGQSVLDLGCGTGQLSAYAAELVGPEGKVTGVDPDERRIQLAMEAYGDVKNLAFSVGSSHQFPNMEEPTYDVIICSTVLHWIPKKEHVFRNAFRALKPGGRLAIQCPYEMIPLVEKAARELFCEVADKLLGMLDFTDMPQVERFCVESGFVIEEWLITANRETFDTKQELLNWFSAASHGRLDLSLVNPERLQKFSPPMEEGKVIMERPKVLQLVAAKPTSPAWLMTLCEKLWTATISPFIPILLSFFPSFLLSFVLLSLSLSPCYNSLERRTRIWNVEIRPRASQVVWHFVCYICIWSLDFRLFQSRCREPTLDKMAEYRKLSSDRQVSKGKEFLERMQCVKEGQLVLDLGCGTGQLSAYVAELVGPKGKVTGVDPDERRVQLATEEYGDVKNLGFSVGSSHQFPNMNEPTYDVIICSTVLHWIPKKEHVFRNAFRALKPGGKLAIQCLYERIPLTEKATREVFCEVADEFLGMLDFTDMPQVERFCVESGFVIEEWLITANRETFDTKQELLNWLSASTHGRLDLSLVTSERLQKFSPPIEGGKVILERPKVLQLVAAKPTSPAWLYVTNFELQLCLPPSSLSNGVNS